MEPSKDRVECHGEVEATAALPDTSGYEEVSSGFPCEFNVCHTVVTDHARESINELQ